MRWISGFSLFGLVCGLPTLALVATSAEAAKARPRWKSVLLRGVPHMQQKPDFCGEACAAMWLQKLGHAHTQDDVFHATELDPAAGRGAYTKELAHGLRRLGFDVGAVWHTTRARTSALLPHWDALHADLLRGIPSIVCTRYDERPKTTEHFRLVLGYDAKRGQVIYHEPAVRRGAYRRMKLARFLSLWPLKYARSEWTVIRMRLAGRDIAAAPTTENGFTDAEYAQHIHALRERLAELHTPGDAQFTIVLERPFVVIGDEPAETVHERAKGTVRWAVERLKRQYFRRDPKHILNVWLFRDRASYLRNTRRLFRTRPDTPYGYYSSRHRALVMNIATGGGTLVHEIVHPFIESNFPDAPAWLNEGLGSLYEQSSARDGRIIGLTNWRLAGLQRLLRAGKLPSFRALLRSTDEAFYEDRRGDNYAQARYLLYYLQERGLLEKFYHAFRANHRRDPSGYATLRATLGDVDMSIFQKRWSAWVLKLSFP
jgi:hypothetical protein